MLSPVRSLITCSTAHAHEKRKGQFLGPALVCQQEHIVLLPKLRHRQDS